MLFNSFTFIFFFIIVVVVNALPLPWRVRKFNLLIASYVFYAAYNPPFVLLLWISTLADWLIARRIAATNSPGGKRAWLLLSLTAGLGMLGYFKYSPQVLAGFSEIAAALGVRFQPPQFARDVILPVGISFYTFQTLSYTIDVYRGKMQPWPSLLDFSLYVAFFPQLVAGPIVRAWQFLPQCVEPKRPTGQQFGWGLSLIILGLFMKIAVADSLFAPVANTVYKPGLRPGMADAWIGTLAFVGQLYTDFSGYSTCAVGLGLCLGFVLPPNFRFPMASIGFSDFWRRWHISLSTWLHDYVFEPLGGYYYGRLRAGIALMITMVLCGIWHGGSWNFLIFGALHGTYMVTEMSLRRTWIARRQLWRTIFGKSLLWILTVILLSFSIVFFRSQSLDQAVAVAQGLAGLNKRTALQYLSDIDLLFVIVPLEVIALFHIFLRNDTLESAVQRWPWWAWSLCLALMLYGIVRIPGGGQSEEFIYFQF